MTHLGLPPSFDVKGTLGEGPYCSRRTDKLCQEQGPSRLLHRDSGPVGRVGTDLVPLWGWL